jgi:hypothetical protein
MKNGKITHLDSPLFTNPQQQESGHPEVISHINTGTWTNLEFPLRRHDFGVDSGNFDTGIQAGSLVVSAIRPLRAKRGMGGVCEVRNGRSVRSEEWEIWGKRAER